MTCSDILNDLSYFKLDVSKNERIYTGPMQE